MGAHTSVRCIALEIKRDTELGIAFEGGPRRGKNERLERKGKKKGKKLRVHYGE